MAPPTDFRAGAARLAATAWTRVDNVVVFEQIDSTQATALRLIEQADTEEIELPTTLIVARHQTHGRGRLDRRWHSPHGGLYLTWLTSGLDRSLIAKLPMIAATAAVEAAIRVGVDGVGIKWPNDLMVAGRKLAGLLIHARHGGVPWVAVGLGVNLERVQAPPETDAAAPTSVADELPGDHDHGLTEQLVETFLDELNAGIAEPLAHLVRWRDRLVHRPGDELKLRLSDGSEIHGRFAGLTDEGHLEVDCDGRRRTIAAGEVVE